MEKGVPGAPEQTPEPIGRQVEKAFDVIKNKEIAEFLLSELQSKILTLVSKHASRADIEKALKPYHDMMGGPDIAAKVADQLVSVIEQALFEKNGRPETMAEKLNLGPGMVFFDTEGFQYLIKKVDLINDSVDLVDDHGVLHTGYTINKDENPTGSFSLSKKNGFAKGKKIPDQQIILSLSTPLHENQFDGLDLEVQETPDAPVPVDLGEVFTDTEGKQWTVEKILARKQTAILCVSSADGDIEYLNLRDWGTQDHEHFIKTMGDRLTLKKEKHVEETPPEEVTPEDVATAAQTEEVSKENQEGENIPVRFLNSIEYSNDETGAMTITKGESYEDDDGIPWNVTNIIQRSHGDEEHEFETITIKHPVTGEVRTISVSDWDVYPGSTVITTLDEKEHLFNVIQEKIAAKKEEITQLEETVTVQETETLANEEAPNTAQQELDKAKQELKDLEDLLGSLDNMLK